jgi:hypothetical protein
MSGCSFCYDVDDNKCRCHTMFDPKPKPCAPKTPCRCDEKRNREEAKGGCCCHCPKLCQDPFFMATLKQKICHLVQKIDLLLYQILCEGEQGEISALVRNGATVLLNAMVECELVIVQNGRKTPITDRYVGTESQEALYYGIQVLDREGDLTPLLVKIISAFNGSNRVSLDLLTVRGEHYLIQGPDSTVVSYGQALGQLKLHLENILLYLERID